MEPQAVIDTFRHNLTNHYFDFKGRVSRQEFWYFVLACFIIFLAAAILDGIAHTGVLGAIVGLALLLPIAGLGARRLQDIGRNGQLVWIWVVLSAINRLIGLSLALSGPLGALGFLYFFFSFGWLLGLAELVIAVVLIYFWVQPGTVGTNQYGPDPKTAAPAAT